MKQDKITELFSKLQNTELRNKCCNELVAVTGRKKITVRNWLVNGRGFNDQIRPIVKAIIDRYVSQYNDIMRKHNLEKFVA